MDECLFSAGILFIENIDQSYNIQEWSSIFLLAIVALSSHSAGLLNYFRARDLHFRARAAKRVNRIPIQT
jgi:hypothetical protein